MLDLFLVQCEPSCSGRALCGASLSAVGSNGQPERMGRPPPSFMARVHRGPAEEGGEGFGAVEDYPCWMTVTTLQILARMRSFGMAPVLPAFAGHVPKGFIDTYPNVQYSELHWNRFVQTKLSNLGIAG